MAKTLGLELASQGRTKEEALKNLQEALDLFLDGEFHRNGEFGELGMALAADKKKKEKRKNFIEQNFNNRQCLRVLRLKMGVLIRSAGPPKGPRS